MRISDWSSDVCSSDLGEDEQDGAPKAYIGQTGTLRQRLSQHGQQKELWNRALVAVSLTSSLTNTHASYLEWLSIAQAQEAGRYSLDNGKAGGWPHTPPPLEAESAELHETIRLLRTPLGYPVFHLPPRSQG